MLEFSEAPVHDITILGTLFPTRQIYDEGHVLTQAEASTLNQTRDENLRNNYSAKIKAAMKEAKAENLSDLPPDALTKLIADFPTWEEGYEFGARGGAREVDPVRKQALLLATDKVKEKLKLKGFKLTDVGPDKIREYAERGVERNPAFLAKAEEIVAARKVASDSLEIDLE